MSKNDRFQIVQEEGNGLTSNHRMVLADTTTGVQYLFVKVGYAGGLCPLVGRDGEPLVRDMEEARSRREPRAKTKVEQKRGGPTGAGQLLRNRRA